MAFEYQGFATLGVNLNRQKYGPLDISNVFTSQADFDYYISKGAKTSGVSTYWYTDPENKVTPYPYEGQIIALVTGSDVKVYVLTTEVEGEFQYKEVGSSTAGDNKTIELKDGVLSLKNFGVKYYRYQASEDEGTPGEYIETPWTDPTYPAPDGLEVKVKKIGEGDYELEYYQPNPTTVEGLQSAISSLQTTVANMYTKQDVYSKTEIDNKFKNDFPSWEDIESSI